MANDKEGPGKGTSQFHFPDRGQRPGGLQDALQTPPGDLARRRQIFFGLMEGLPRAYQNIEHKLLGEPSPETLARKRQIFFGLMEGLPRAYADTYPAISNPATNPQLGIHTGRLSNHETVAPLPPRNHNVLRLRSFIQQEQSARGAEIPPQAIIQERLSRLATTAVSGPETAPVWDRLASAWDALTHDSYPLGSIWERRAGFRLYRHYQAIHSPVIKLHHDDTLTLDAIAEAAGSPLTRGIAVIEIPAHLRDYEAWSTSQEYRERVLNPNKEHRQ